MKQGLKDDEKAFYHQFTTDFFSVDGELMVSEADRARPSAWRTRPTTTPR